MDLMGTEYRRLAMAGAVLLVVLALSSSPAAISETVVVGGQDGWDDGHATFYGDEGGAETMQGACGYGNLFEQGYGLETTALSVALFGDGWSCGGCYEVRCVNSGACRPGGAAVRVTATNLCPANYSKPDENWCNPPLKHLDLSKPMFLNLVTDFRVGIIPVQFRRVPCVKSGGVRFQMGGNQWWLNVLAFNVAGAGDVKAMAVRGSRDGLWRDMPRNWGQIWNLDSQLLGQGLSFRAVAGDGRSIVLNDVVPPNWAIGQTFQAREQF